VDIAKLTQRRVANISAGASTLRGQPKDSVSIAIKNLQSINLKNFSDVTSDQFEKLLDEHVEKLRKEPPSKSWDIARKVLNIFLFQATHDIILNKNYNFKKIIPYLEVPLDNKNAKKLKKLAKKEGKRLSWKNIKSLNPEINAEFQGYAKTICISKKVERCYLDLLWWRSKSNDS